MWSFSLLERTKENLCLANPKQVVSANQTDKQKFVTLLTDGRQVLFALFCCGYIVVHVILLLIFFQGSLIDIEVIVELPSSSEVLNIWITIQWRHNGRDSVSNHQPHDCLLNGLFKRRSKKTSKLRITGLCVGNSPGTGEFPAQMASNAENVSIWWRHHDVVQSHDT